jgi:hypothetical protein
MQTIKQSIVITTNRHTLWQVLLQDSSYRVWAAVFHPGAYAQTDWEEGGKVLFLTPEGDGMSSRIVRHQPGYVISMQHQAILKNGVEEDKSPEADKWKYLYEIYRAVQTGNHTTLFIEADIDDKYLTHFTAKWQQALLLIKQLCEAQAPAI